MLSNKVRSMSVVARLAARNGSSVADHIAAASIGLPIPSSTASSATTIAVSTNASADGNRTDHSLRPNVAILPAMAQ